MSIELLQNCLVSKITIVCLTHIFWEERNLRFVSSTDQNCVTKGKCASLSPSILKDLILAAAAPNTHDSSFLEISFLIPAANPLTMVYVYRMTILYTHSTSLTLAHPCPFAAAIHLKRRCVWKILLFVLYIRVTQTTVVN